MARENPPPVEYSNFVFEFEDILLVSGIIFNLCHSLATPPLLNITVMDTNVEDDTPNLTQRAPTQAPRNTAEQHAAAAQRAPGVFPLSVGDKFSSRVDFIKASRNAFYETNCNLLEDPIIRGGSAVLLRCENAYNPRPARQPGVKNVLTLREPTFARPARGIFQLFHVVLPLGWRVIVAIITEALEAGPFVA